MKTAGRENPNRWATLFSNRAPGAGGQNRSCSITWAAKRGNGQPLERCFFLTSTFIERSRWTKRRSRWTKRRRTRLSFSTGGAAVSAGVPQAVVLAPGDLLPYVDEKLPVYDRVASLEAGYRPFHN